MKPKGGGSITKKTGTSHALPVLFLCGSMNHLLSVVLIGNGEFLAALGAARSQHTTTVLGGHSLTETVLVHSPAIVGLKCSFHYYYVFIFIVFAKPRPYSTFWGAKVLISFETTKFSSIFSVFFCFFS